MIKGWVRKSTNLIKDEYPTGGKKGVGQKVNKLKINIQREAKKGWVRNLTKDEYPTQCQEVGHIKKEED